MVKVRKVCIYKYPRPAVATDCVVFGYDNQSKKMKVLLIKRGRNDCYKNYWAFPGGFVRMNETVKDCAFRELKEETSVKIKPDYLEQFHIFSNPKRDKRKRVISVAFLALVKDSDVKGNSDAKEARWFTLKDNIDLQKKENQSLIAGDFLVEGELLAVEEDKSDESEKVKRGKLAFDHDEMFFLALKELREIVFFKPIVFNLLPNEFTMTELQILYEKILGVEFDRRNFSKKMKASGILMMVENGDDEVAKKKVRYTFNKAGYDNMKKADKKFEF